MDQSETLRRWRHANFNVRDYRRTIADLGVGAHPNRVKPYRPGLDKWTAERERLYTLLDADDKVIADRERVLPLR